VRERRCAAGEHLAQRAELAAPRRAAAPDQTDRAARHRGREGAQRDAAAGARLDLHRGGGQQRDAEAVRHHLHQRSEAGRLHAARLARAGRVAERERLGAEAVALLQQHHRLAPQRGLRHRAVPARERMRGGHRQHERLLEERERIQIVALDRQRQQQQLELAAAQPRQDALGLVLAQQQLEPGPGRAHGRQRAREQIGRHGRDHAQREAAGEGTLRRARLVDQVVDPLQRLAGALEHPLAGGGHQHLAPAPLEELHPEQLLELPDLERERRLGHRAGARRAAEVAGMAQGDQIL
jgi:hypothetical protein